jgi:hypothetical protein
MLTQNAWGEIAFEARPGADGTHVVMMLVDGEAVAEFSVEGALEMAEQAQSAAWEATLAEAGALAADDETEH